MDPYLDVTNYASSEYRFSFDNFVFCLQMKNSPLLPLLCDSAIETVDTELQSARSMFGEKVKELSFAVAKVDALTRQLEELQNGNTSNSYQVVSSSSSSNLRLREEQERLQQDLLSRRQLYSNGISQLDFKKSLLDQKKCELSQLDAKIIELNDRLAKKKLLNRNNINNNSMSQVAFPNPKQDPKYQTLPFNTKFSSNSHIVPQHRQLLLPRQGNHSLLAQNQGSINNATDQQLRQHLLFPQSTLLRDNNISSAASSSSSITSSSTIIIRSSSSSSKQVTSSSSQADHHRRLLPHPNHHGVSSLSSLENPKSLLSSSTDRVVNGLHHQQNQELTRDQDIINKTTTHHIVNGVDSSSPSQNVINGNHRQSKDNNEKDVVDRGTTFVPDRGDSSSFSLTGSTAPCIDWQKVRRRAVVVDDDMERALSIPSSYSSGTSSLTSPSSSSSSSSSQDSSPERTESNKLLHKIMESSSSSSSSSSTSSAVNACERKIMITRGDSERISPQDEVPSDLVLLEEKHRLLQTQVVKDTPALLSPLLPSDHHQSSSSSLLLVNNKKDESCKEPSYLSATTSGQEKDESPSQRQLDDDDVCLEKVSSHDILSHVNHRSLEGEEDSHESMYSGSDVSASSDSKTQSKLEASSNLKDEEEKDHEKKMTPIKGNHALFAATSLNHNNNNVNNHDSCSIEKEDESTSLVKRIKGNLKYPAVNYTNFKPNGKQDSIVDNSSSSHLLSSFPSSLTNTLTSSNNNSTSNNSLASNKKNGQQQQESQHKTVTRRVSFDPLALLLDAALEGELDLVKKTALQVSFCDIFSGKRRPSSSLTTSLWSTSSVCYRES